MKNTALRKTVFALCALFVVISTASAHDVVKHRTSGDLWGSGMEETVQGEGESSERDTGNLDNVESNRVAPPEMDNFCGWPRECKEAEETTPHRRRVSLWDNIDGLDDNLFTLPDANDGTWDTSEGSTADEMREYEDSANWNADNFDNTEIDQFTLPDTNGGTWGTTEWEYEETTEWDNTDGLDEEMTAYKEAEEERIAWEKEQARLARIAQEEAERKQARLARIQREKDRERRIAQEEAEEEHIAWEKEQARLARIEREKDRERRRAEAAEEQRERMAELRQQTESNSTDWLGTGLEVFGAVLGALNDNNLGNSLGGYQAQPSYQAQPGYQAQSRGPCDRAIANAARRYPVQGAGQCARSKSMIPILSSVRGVCAGIPLGGAGGATGDVESNLQFWKGIRDSLC